MIKRRYLREWRNSTPATISQTPRIRLYNPNSRARVIEPMPGRAAITTPKAMDTSPAKFLKTPAEPERVQRHRARAFVSGQFAAELHQRQRVAPSLGHDPLAYPLFQRLPG